MRQGKDVVRRVLPIFAVATLLAACANDPASTPPLSREMTPPVARAATAPMPVSTSRPWSAETTPATAHPTATPNLAAPSPQPAPAPTATRANEAGLASYYWQDQMTASGERFDKRAMTAAHRTLPLGTRVRVTHMKTGKSVVVRINDRGPFKPNRIIDLSEAAAEQIEMTKAGLAPVTVELAN
jgi:rare lipoprotein A